ncbi:acyl-CoA dehydrogenase family protein [Rhodococcus sp. MSC1_016]|jgi:alkylation response protein AidB-like acyl-CoA dehydrogenase|uniref:acyl-CoA dehydrogenase family protein n=1 Tax=Rhodococcus sp. MSC1_016 TaxID=2909266 RepID=UPI00202F8645|nr:acyl-CoA dehydrogenase family protein [Rhodococcus sp. MSC1_016]
MTIDPEQERLSADLQQLAVDRLRPLAAKAEQDGGLPAEFADTLASLPSLPGSDAFSSGVEDPLAFCLAAQALGWADPALTLGWLTARQVAWLIAASGTPTQRDRYLPRLAADPTLPVSLLFFEGYGRAPSELDTTARKVEDGWILNGIKTAVANAGTAEFGIIVARDEEGGLRAFVVDDLSAVRYRGNDERWLSLQAVNPAAYAEISNLHVGPEAALSVDAIAEALSVCRLAQASLVLGVSESATRYAADWGVQRNAFGRPLVGFQGVAFVLANLFMDIESTKAQRDNALSALAEGLDDSELITSRVVAQTNHLVRNASREGIELMGVHGVITDHPVERIYRSAALLAAIDFDPLLNPLVLSNN